MLAIRQIYFQQNILHCILQARRTIELLVCFNLLGLVFIQVSQPSVPYVSRKT